MIPRLDWHRKEARRGYQTEGRVKSTKGPNPVVAVRFNTSLDLTNVSKKLQR